MKPSDPSAFGHALMLNQPMVRHALWMSLEWTINRYLMSNAHGRQSGAEKAQRHDEMCRHYVALLHGVSIEDRPKMREYDEECKRVRERTRLLTDHLDEVIGFPVDSTPDYEVLAPLFFNAFHMHAVDALRNTFNTSDDVEHPAQKLMRERFEAEHGINHPIASKLNAYYQVRKDYDSAWNRDRDTPTTKVDVVAAEHAVFDAAAVVYRAPAAFPFEKGVLHDQQ